MNLLASRTFADRTESLYEDAFGLIVVIDCLRLSLLCTVRVRAGYENTFLEAFDL